MSFEEWWAGYWGTRLRGHQAMSRAFREVARDAWNARVAVGEATTLDEMDEGALFTTHEGEVVTGIRTEYWMGEGKDRHSLVVLAGSGEYGGEQLMQQQVREVKIWPAAK